MSTMNFSQYMAALKGLGADLDESARRTLERMNAKGMETTTKNTPVGQYPAGSGKQGGTLRRGWHNGGTHKVGNGHESRYYNNVYYGPYVNDGHRLVNRRGETVGYVEGQRFLERGQDAAKEAAPAIFSEEIQRVKSKGGW